MLIDRWSPARTLLVLVCAALVTAGAGVWLLAGAGDGATRRHVTVSGVPLDEVHPSGVAPGERRPGVVVAHGFAGSARLMAPFGDSLAAAGYVVVLPDFTGHGANTRRLPDGAAGSDASTAALQRDLDVAVAHLRSLPDVDPSRIALVGHSMGAGAVTRYAVAHPDITATVAISLPGASTVLPDRPARLQLLVGALEFADFRAEAARAAEPRGPNRSLVVVPGVEHISILFSHRTHRATVSWLDASFGRPATGPLPAPGRRAGGAALLLLALAVGLYPVARLLLGRPAGDRPRPAVRLGRTAAVAAGATVLGALVAPLLPTDRLPLAVGGYVVGLTVVAGLVMLVFRRRDTPPPVAGRRPALAAPVLLAYAAAAIAVPMQLGLTHAVPAGARWWLLPCVWAGFALLAYAGERLAGGRTAGVLVVSALVVLGLTGAATAGLTNGFVLLVVPLLAVLLLWQAAWSAALHRLTAPTWLIALTGSLVVAWPLATTLPLIR